MPSDLGVFNDSSTVNSSAGSNQVQYVGDNATAALMQQINAGVANTVREETQRVFATQHTANLIREAANKEGVSPKLVGETLDKLAKVNPDVYNAMASGSNFGEMAAKLLKNDSLAAAAFTKNSIEFGSMFGEIMAREKNRDGNIDSTVNGSLPRGGRLSAGVERKQPTDIDNTSYGVTGKRSVDTEGKVPSVAVSYSLKDLDAIEKPFLDWLSLPKNAPIQRKCSRMQKYVQKGN